MEKEIEQLEIRVALLEKRQLEMLQMILKNAQAILNEAKRE